MAVNFNVLKESMVHRQNCIIFVFKARYKNLWGFFVKSLVFTKSFETTLVQVYSDFYKQIMIA